MFLSIILLIQIPYFEDKGMLLVLVGCIVFVILYNYLIRTFATYLYCRFALRMSVGLSQAKQLNNAFSPTFPINLKWLPMTEIKNLDNAIKYQAALDIFRKWEEDKKQRRTQQLQDFKNSTQKTKLLTMVKYFLVVYFMLAGLMNLPPANLLAEAYCKLFDTEEYYPFLNGIVLAVSTILLFKAIDKNVK